MVRPLDVDKIWISTPLVALFAHKWGYAELIWEFVLQADFATGTNGSWVFILEPLAWHAESVCPSACHKRLLYPALRDLVSVETWAPNPIWQTQILHVTPMLLVRKPRDNWPTARIPRPTRHNLACEQKDRATSGVIIILSTSRGRTLCAVCTPAFLGSYNVASSTAFFPYHGGRCTPGA